MAELRAALDAELAATPEYYDFKVLRSERDGSLWRVTLVPGYVFAEGQRPGQHSAQALLDDSLDGASAWWGAPLKGGASVLAVVPEDEQLVLQNASSPPPGADCLIRLYPTRYLNALADAWWDTPWAERALACLPDLARPQALDTTAPPLSGAPFRWLRSAQRQALSLVEHSSAFLWGPPGTGKTTTLGVLLAEYLDSRPQARVLLLSTTNQAVDLATLAVDKALQKGRREHCRAAVQRLGTRFDAAAYAGREHLTPPGDQGLITRLARAEAARPTARDAAALKAWAERVAGLREQLRAASLQVLQRCRLASMTTTRAAFTLKTLRELSPDGEPPFDLLVFDEASQLSLAHALALMPLGRARLFAGDPQQLSPVQRSPDRAARKWLGRSAFSEKPRQGPSVALLDEQSRMAGPISALVSDLFYEGALRVAADAQAAPAWAQARRRALGDIGADTHVHVHRLQTNGAWSAAERGPLRAESAEAIASTVAAALGLGNGDEAGAWQPHELIVLTPFRAQRALIRQHLRAHGVPESVKVSTVHRAQGSEAPVLFFDPVDGSQPFLQTEEAQRLINVALSRAQAKILVYLSPADAANPLLAPIVQRLRLAGDARAVTPLLALARQPDFPANTLGRRVSAGRHTGEVSHLSPDGQALWLINERSGASQAIDVGFWRRKAGETT
nr:AAA domain-containing protein [Roseateles oligotrophus]